MIFSLEGLHGGIMMGDMGLDYEANPMCVDSFLCVGNDSVHCLVPFSTPSPPTLLRIYLSPVPVPPLATLDNFSSSPKLT